MKNLIFIPVLLFISLSYAQEIKYSSFKKEIDKFQRKLNKEFEDPQESPLTKEDLEVFKSLDFFPADTNFRVVAAVKRTKDPKPFKMKTTTDRLPLYTIYAYVSFKLKGKTFNMPIYQNQKLMQTPEFEDYLFLPFTDLTNGKSTYGGGRYLDLEIPEGDTMIIDFNKAYNPYCAYNGKYSCPVTPKENHINVAINAGVKNFKGHQ
jgi:uncharacterized protein (DUF1684 family)